MRQIRIRVKQARQLPPTNMSEASGSSAARKRPHEAPTDDGSNKNQRISQSVDNVPGNKPDGKYKDECASQTFVTDDGRFIKDSIPNHVRRHDTELAKQGKNLNAVLNAHHGFEEQLRRHGEQLAENKQAIRQVENNGSSKSIEALDKLDTIARDDNEFKQQLDTFKTMVQTRFDVMDRERIQQNSKVHETLSAMAKCFQELGHLAEPAVEASPPAAVQDAVLKVNPDEESDDNQERPHVSLASGDVGPSTWTPQGFVNSNGSLQVYSEHYLSWLESLDFRPRSGMARYKMATLRFHEHELFTYYGSTYYIVVNSGQLPHIHKQSREERGHDDGDGDFAGPPYELDYRDHILELKPPKPLLRQADLPRYVLPLGHLFVNSPGKADPVHWTGFHVVMDVTTPAKALWLVHCNKGESRQEHTDWPFLFTHLASGGIGSGYDLFKLAPYPKAISGPAFDVSTDVKVCMSMHAHKAKPVFTVPDVDSLLAAIQEGWARYER
ncbi:hypothetical protein PG993_006275 [Apiospora rasikravindrae]|uniref:Uncharacterized protein n=1 Tax=Apiospora rasikravindrae TaxID=990691 RepID=A0ABR1T5Q7_9PEZI